MAKVFFEHRTQNFEHRTLIVDSISASQKKRSATIQQRFIYRGQSLLTVVRCLLSIFTKRTMGILTSFR